MGQNGSMIGVRVRFYAGLNQYLPVDRRGYPLSASCAEGTTIHQLLVDYGIPASEVQLILINGVDAALTSILHEGDRVALYPAFQKLDAET
jgi:hypothetical protein